MNSSRMGAAPYVVVLLAAIFFYHKTTQLGFEAPGGRIGPDAWPRIVLTLMALVCAYEIVKRLFSRGVKPEAGGVLGTGVQAIPEDASQATADAQPSYPWLLATGVLMTIAYAALLGTLGFFLCTLLYLVGFILLGGYRRIVVTLVTSLVGSLAFLFMFMKVVYVSLPLGVEPFAQLSYLLMRLMGIR